MRKSQGGETHSGSTGETFLEEKGEGKKKPGIKSRKSFGRGNPQSEEGDDNH